MNEQELINIIGKLIDADLNKFGRAEQGDIARRAFGRCRRLAPLGAVEDLVGQVMTHKLQPWVVLPGTRPRLRELADGVMRIAPKPTPLEIFHAGMQKKEPVWVICNRVGMAYPQTTGDEMDAIIQQYLDWLDRKIEAQEALARQLERRRSDRSSRHGAA